MLSSLFAQDEIKRKLLTTDAFPISFSYRQHVFMNCLSKLINLDKKAFQ